VVATASPESVARLCRQSHGHSKVQAVVDKKGDFYNVIVELAKELVTALPKQ